MKQHCLQYCDQSNYNNRKGAVFSHSIAYSILFQSDEVNLDIFWLKDESLEDTENLPDPDILARNIVENLESAFDGFIVNIEIKENIIGGIYV